VISKRNISRRKALASIGGSVAGLSVLSTGATAQVADDLRMRSLRMRDENDWSVEEWRQYLAANGAELRTSDNQFRIPSLSSTSDDDGSLSASPTELDFDKCTLKITYGYNFYGSNLQYYFDLAWEIDTDGNILSDTSGPVDLPTIGWLQSHYLKDGDVYYGPRTSNPQNKDSTQITGVVAAYDVAADGELTKAENIDADSWTLDSYFNVPVQVVDDSTADERRVEVDYHHRYGVANFQGISWGGGIPSIALGYGEEQWVREAEPTESQMEGTYVDTT
jgi:hypothetical protein